MNPISDAIGNRIRSARLQKGLTQAELAEKAAIAINSIRLYESGKRVPKIDNLQKIADALNVSIQYLAPSFVTDSKDGDGIVDLLNDEKLNKSVSEFSKRISVICQIEDNEKRLLSAYHSMNQTGREKAISVVEDLAKVPEYRRKKDTDSGETSPDTSNNNPMG